MQGVNEEVELDEVDNQSTTTHFVARGQSIVGTCRLFPHKSNSRWGKVGRLAVLPAVRGRGIGSALLRAAEQHAEKAGMQGVILHAQTPARRFYERAGYEVCSSEFLEDGLSHVAMRKALK